MSLKVKIDLPMTEVARVFNSYKKAYGTQPTPESVLTFSADLNDVKLDDIIREIDLTPYDSQAFNKAFFEMLSKGISYNASFIYDMLIYQRYCRPLGKYWKGMPEVTLQVGPGGSLGCEVLLSMAGTKKAYTLDRFPLLRFNLDSFMQVIDKFSEVIRLTHQISGIDKFPYKPDYETINERFYRIGNSHIEHVYPRSFEESGLDSGIIDFLFSHATFEHVRAPLKCIKEIRRLLKPGGLTAHCIDLRDHRNFDHPLRFLRESDESWEEIMKEYCKYDGSGYMNRWRASDFRKAFELEGFEILECNAEMEATAQVIEAEMPLLDKKYRTFSREDLAVTTLFVVARKNK